MPLSKERMTVYMREYRKTHPEYSEKIKNRYNEKYNNNPEFREKRKEYFIRYNLKKQQELNSEKVEEVA